MRIHDFRLDSDGASRRASASVEWEDSPRPAQRLAFSSEGALGPFFEPAPEAFALSAVFAAARAGERRLRVEADLCPVLADGLRSAMALLDSWYGGTRAAMTVEAARFRTRPRGAPGAALFLSGGVDSLHLLRRNSADFPRSHPDSFRVLLHVRAFGYSGRDNAGAARDVAARSLPAVTRMARARETDLAILETGAQLLDLDRKSFLLESHGGLLAATAHLFPGAFDSVSVAASADLRGRFPGWGSHPLLDPEYGSSGLAVRHCGHEYSRLEKVADLARWDLAMDALLVCNEAPLPDGVVNCGRCEKCLRTLCELLAAGALERASTFAVRDVSADSIRRLLPKDDFPGHSWRDLPRSLSQRPELAGAVEEWIERLSRSADWWEDRGWKGRLRKVDRNFLGGGLLALRRRWSAGS